MGHLFKDAVYTDAEKRTQLHVGFMMAKRAEELNLIPRDANGYLKASAVQFGAGYLDENLIAAYVETCVEQGSNDWVHRAPDKAVALYFTKTGHVPPAGDVLHTI